MLKVANMIEDGRIAGPQRRMVVVARELEGRVATTLVIPARDSEPLQALCREAGVRFRTIATARGAKSPGAMLAYLLRFPFDLAAARRALRGEAVDLVHVSGGAWQFKSVIAARLAGRPVIWHLNDTSMPRPIRAVFRLAAPLASGLIYASERTRAYYEGLAPERPAAIVPAVVDPTRFDPQKAPAPAPEIAARLGDAPVVGTVANVNPNKGLETFLEAFAQVSRTQPEARALVVGPVFASQKAYHQQLRDQAEALGIGDKVIWAGEQQDVRALLARIDVYLCSSRFESSPMAVWEAMSMGRAVVSSNVGDVPLHIENGENGYVTAVGDATAMATHIAGLLTDAPRRAALGARARITATESFAPAIIAAKTEAIYRRIVPE